MHSDSPFYLKIFLLINLLCFGSLNSGCALRIEQYPIGMPEASRANPNEPTSPHNGRWFLSLTQSPLLSWKTSPSSVSHYEYSLGTTTGSTNILSWTSAGASLFAQATGLSLTQGTSYFMNVRASYSNGLVSAAVSVTQPWKVLTTGASAFQTKADFTTATGPRDPQFHDFNHDDRLDIIVTEGTPSSSVSLLLGNGDGTFQAATSFPLLSNGQELAVGDFNNDGKLDFAAGNYNAGPPTKISVFLGNGDGTFGARADYDTAIRITSIAQGDFNQDGYLDFVTTSDGSLTIEISINDGNGVFVKTNTYATQDRAKKVVVADFNHDGLLDIATANEGAASSGTTVSVFLGVGDGTFGARQDFTVGTNPRGLDYADINGDGHLDLVTGNFMAATVSVLTGKGDGTFNAKTDYSVGTSPHGVRFIDVNGDLQPDILVANSGSNTLGILLGNKDGTFQTMFTLATGTTPYRISGGDVNGDGKTDLVISNSGTNTVSVFITVE